MIFGAIGRTAVCFRKKLRCRFVSNVNGFAVHLPFAPIIGPIGIVQKVGNKSRDRANRDACEVLRLGHEGAVLLLVNAGASDDVLERALQMRPAKGLATLLKIVDPNLEPAARILALEKEAIRGEGRIEPGLLKFLRRANAGLYERQCLALYYAMWIDNVTLLERLINANSEYAQPAAVLLPHAIKKGRPSLLSVLLQICAPPTRQATLCYLAYSGDAGLFLAALNADQDDQAIWAARDLARDYGHDEILAMIGAYFSRRAARQTLDSAKSDSA